MEVSSQYGKNPLDRYIIRWKIRVKIYVFDSSFLLLVLWGSGEITQLIKVLLYKHKGPDFYSKNLYKEDGSYHLLLSSHGQEVDMGAPGILWLASLA